MNNRKLHMHFRLASSSMTLNYNKFELGGGGGFCRFWRQKWLNPYCQRHYCSPLNILFSNVYITMILLGVCLLGSTIRIQWAKWRFSTSICNNILQVASNMATVAIINTGSRSRWFAVDFFAKGLHSPGAEGGPVCIQMSPHFDSWSL